VSAPLTLGVVGHVDHGKTALVRALTGIETDRLEEERRRGLSIVLGFSYLETANGVVDLIDVPGHEDFIRAMISGATGLDGIVLCIAANEGVMPQTVEHFNIVRLLGVERGFVVITKADLVEPDELGLVREEVAEFTAGTFLESAPVVEASVATGAGLDRVRTELERLVADPVAHAVEERFFMPLDRVFTMRGFGLVCTGTLRRGRIHVNDPVEVMPGGKAATVRALQNHGKPVEHAEPGQRVAVNLRGLGRDEIDRGQVLATPGLLAASRRLDVELVLLADAPAPVGNGATVRLLTGTTEAMARLRLLDRAALEPGATCLAQLSLDREIATAQGERFLIRTYSPMHTVGGGRIIDANAARHRRFDASVTRELESAAAGDFAAILRQRLETAGIAGVDLAALAAETGEYLGALESLAAQLDTVQYGEHRVVTADAFEDLVEEVVTALERFHAENPRQNGLGVGGLRKALESNPGGELLDHALASLLEQGRLERTQGLLSLAGFDPFAGLAAPERRALEDIERRFRDSGIEVPTVREIVGTDRTRQALYRLLLETGRLVRLKTYDRSVERVLHASTLEQVKETLAAEYPYPAAFAMKDVRDLLGSTRKHVVPLMEHLDAAGTTVRSGDLRRLRPQ